MRESGLCDRDVRAARALRLPYPRVVSVCQCGVIPEHVELDP